MGLFDVDYDALIARELRKRWRSAIHVAWLLALVQPIKELHSKFTAGRKARLYELAHGPQVAHLEGVLNDAFDSTNRGIYISNGPLNEPAPLYLDAELKPAPLYLESEGIVEVLYLESETFASGADFIVHVPAAVVYDLAKMKALIDKYKLATKLYTIVTI